MNNIIFNIYSINKNAMIQSTKVKNKDNCANSITFEGRLTRLARKSPNVTEETLQAMNGIFTRDHGIAGVYPEEFISAIKENIKGSDLAVKDSVEGIRTTLSEVVPYFEKVDYKIFKNTERFCDNLNFDKALKETILRITAILEPKKAREMFKKQKNSYLPSKDFIKEIEVNVAKIIETGFKKYKIIPEDAKVIVKRLDDGGFGTAYRIAFLDKDNNRIFRDKVIKYYKDNKIKDRLSLKFSLKRTGIIKENQDRFIQSVRKYFDKLIADNVSNAEKVRDDYFNQDIFKLPVEKVKESIRKQYKEWSYKVKMQNGLYKEANWGNYIRKSSGNDLINSNIVKYYYTDFNNRYALLDFSDLKMLGPVIRSVDLKSMGLVQSDISSSGILHNYVENRLIDYGCFEVKNEILSNNPVARRTYKKIKHIKFKNKENTKQERTNLWSKQYLKAYTNNTSQNSDVLIGLDEARALILEQSI